ncbi:hypothetical protein [uncultured Shimia sp.]|uniref:hypothetical protein n=1 Tax=uncultured Shimia sp. TaxID=573152 RepID=UPI002618F057|nr:hypothetical protein [uncultured Shimia sp.]
MSGWKLFVHSVRMVMVNWPHAIRVSVPLIVCYVAGFLLIGDIMVQDLEPGVPPEDLGPIFGMVLLIVIGSIWTVVAWHRFVLLEEFPNAVPTFHGGRILSYIAISLLLALVIGVLSGVLLFVGALFGQAIPALMLGVTAIAMIFGIWVFYRLSPILPATAVGSTLTFRQAWEATAPLSTTVMIAAALTFAVSFVLSIVQGALTGMVPAIGLSSAIAANCFMTLIGASLLTTIYGVSIENREL